MSHSPLGTPRPLSRAVRLALFGLGLGGVPALALLPGMAVAQNQVMAFHIQPGELGQTLSLFATAANITLSFSAEQTRNRQSAGLDGNYDIDAGLARLLAGSGLKAQREANGGYILVHDEAALELDSTTVTGAEDSTEATGAYTLGKPSSTATKLGLSLKETPQSISVITRQRLDDQHLDSLNDVVEATVGLSSFNQGIGTDLDQPYSRGFLISNYLVDGLPNTASKMFSLNGSTAMYDRVEVVRGGYG